MAKNRVLFVVEIVLLLAVSFSIIGCGGGRAPSQATPRPTASHPLDTGPPGLPLYCPAAIRVDKEGYLYVTDSDQGQSHRARIVKLSPTGQLLAEWHVFTTFHGYPSGPFGLAVDAQGNVYVTDAGDNTIKKLSPTGEVLAVWGKTGTAPGELNWPEGVAVDTQGNVYVADFGNGRIQKFSSTGTVLAVWGNTGQQIERIKSPVGIDLDAQGNVYVADVRAHRIVKLSGQGKLLAVWGQANGKVFSSAKGITLDQMRNIYITDARNSRMVKLSPTGKVLTIWEKLAKSQMVGIAVDSEGTIYLSADYNLVKISSQGTLLFKWKGTCSF